jgi:hypothetical protein
MNMVDSSTKAPTTGDSARPDTMRTDSLRGDTARRP